MELILTIALLGINFIVSARTIEMSVEIIRDNDSLYQVYEKQGVTIKTVSWILGVGITTLMIIIVLGGFGSSLRIFGIIFCIIEMIGMIGFTKWLENKNEQVKEIKFDLFRNIY